MSQDIKVNKSINADGVSQIDSLKAGFAAALSYSSSDPETSPVSQAQIEEMERKQKQNFSLFANYVSNNDKIDFDDMEGIYDAFANSISADGIMDREELAQVETAFEITVPIFSKDPFVTRGVFMSAFFKGPATDSSAAPSLDFEQARFLFVTAKALDGIPFNVRPASQPYRDLDNLLSEVNKKYFALVKAQRQEDSPVPYAAYQELKSALMALQPKLYECNDQTLLAKNFLSQARDMLEGFGHSFQNSNEQDPANPENISVYELIKSIMKSFKQESDSIGEFLSKDVVLTPWNIDGSEKIQSILLGTVDYVNNLSNNDKNAEPSVGYTLLKAGGNYVGQKQLDAARTAFDTNGDRAFDRDEWNALIAHYQFHPERYDFDRMSSRKINGVECVDLLDFYGMFDYKFEVHASPETGEIEYGISFARMANMFFDPNKVYGQAQVRYEPTAAEIEAQDLQTRIDLGLPAEGSAPIPVMGAATQAGITPPCENPPGKPRE